MKCAVIQSTFPSSNGVNEVNYYIYQNETVSPRGIIQISHGMCEYFLRYDAFARYLADQGYIVCGNDHIGHGCSVRNPKELGYFSENNGWTYLVEDVHRLTKIMQSSYPKLPCLIMGHSMGSFIVRLYLDRYSEEVDAAILSGTGGNPLAKAGITVSKMVKGLRGAEYRSELIKKMTGLDGTKYDDPYSELDWLSRDHSVIDQYSADQKCNFTFTVSAYIDLFSMIQMTGENRWGKNIRRDLPIYLFSGKDDPVGGFGKEVKKVYQHLQQLGIQDVELKLYPKGRHEMLNEINRDEVYQDTLDWIGRHSAITRSVSDSNH